MPCPRTSSTWSETSSATVSSSRSRRCRTTSPPTPSSRRCWAGSPCPSSPSGSNRTYASAPERLLQRLDWQVIRRLDGLLQGDYRSLFHGNGVDLAALREYQP